MAINAVCVALLNAHLNLKSSVGVHAAMLAASWGRLSEAASRLSFSRLAGATSSCHFRSWRCGDLRLAAREPRAAKTLLPAMLPGALPAAACSLQMSNDWRCWRGSHYGTLCSCQVFWRCPLSRPAVGVDCIKAPQKRMAVAEGRSDMMLESKCADHPSGAAEESRHRTQHPHQATERTLPDAVACCDRFGCRSASPRKLAELLANTVDWRVRRWGTWQLWSRKA